MFGKKLKDPQILKLLSSVLSNKETLHKVSNVSPNAEERMYNFYSMLIFTDAVIKYQIIVGDDAYWDKFLEEITKLSRLYKNHQELVIGIHSLLGQIVMLQLGLSDLNTYENKRSVLMQIYNRYIVNGYCYHSFPSVFQEEVEFNGINPKNYQYPIDKMKQIAYIFENHSYKNFILKRWEEKEHPIYITDSFLMAYYYALSSPSYFSNMTATSPYMKDSSYDKFAYYRKDYAACEKNLHSIGEHIHLSQVEQERVNEAFKKQWEVLKLDESKPCIAFIKRQAVGRDKLDDFAQILSQAENEDFSISMARILDSKYPNDKQFSSIFPLDFIVEKMPTYQEFDLENASEQDEKIPLPIFEKEMESIEIEEDDEEFEEENTFVFSKPVNNHGYADVIALCGFLSIVSGLTLILILNYFKMR